MTNGKPRDWFDVVDLLAKVVSGVFLAALTFVIPNASEKIAAALDTGKLVQALMSDLTAPAEQTRQDLALIALNRSVGNHNALLVTDIAERIYFDLTTRDSLHHNLGRVAFSVLQERKPARATFIEDSIKRTVSAPSVDTLRAGPPSPQVQLLGRIHPLIAYIQFHDEADRELAKRLATRLTAAGFWTPDVERVDGKYKDWIRYFHASDAAVAAQAGDIVQQFLDSGGRAARVCLQDLSTKKFRAPQGQIEIWLGPAPSDKSRPAADTRGSAPACGR